MRCKHPSRFVVEQNGLQHGAGALPRAPVRHNQQTSHATREAPTCASDQRSARTAQNAQQHTAKGASASRLGARCLRSRAKTDARGQYASEDAGVRQRRCGASFTGAPQLSASALAMAVQNIISDSMGAMLEAPASFAAPQARACDGRANAALSSARSCSRRRNAAQCMHGICKCSDTKCAAQYLRRVCAIGVRKTHCMKGASYSPPYAQNAQIGVLLEMNELYITYCFETLWQKCVFHLYCGEKAPRSWAYDSRHLRETSE